MHLRLFFFGLIFFICFSTAKKFEVFGCGVGNRLGIGENSAKPIQTPTPVILPEEVKATTFIRLSCSTKTNIIETTDSHFVFGLNQNSRLSSTLFTDQSVIATPIRLPKTNNLPEFRNARGDIINVTRNLIMNLNQYTFEVFKPNRFQSYYLKLSGYPQDLETYLPALAPSNQMFDWDPHYWPRSLYTRAHLQADTLQFVINTQKLSKLFTESVDFSPITTSLPQKIASYLNHFMYLKQNMELFIENSNGEALEDPRIIGINSLSVAQFSKRGLGRETENKGNFFRSLAETPLIIQTNEGIHRQFRNIWNGPSSTIALTKDFKFIAWGSNGNNLFGFPDKRKDDSIIFPPVVVKHFPAFEDIKQISIGFKHTLILLKNSTVLGVGCNENGELGRNDTTTFQNFIKIQFPQEEENCISAKTCSVEMVAAEKDVSFFVVKYGNEYPSNVKILPVCYGTPSIDVNTCGSGGFCVNTQCRCLDGFDEKTGCSTANDCKSLDNCGNVGSCVDGSLGKQCNCPDFSQGTNCIKPKCGADYQDPCSRNGKCVFVDNTDAKCECNENWTGKYCAKGPNSNLLLFSAGDSTFGSTGTGNWGFVSNFTRVDFHLSENPLNVGISDFAHKDGVSAFVIGNHLHVFGSNVVPSVGTIGESQNLVYNIPFFSGEAMQVPLYFEEIAVGPRAIAVKSSGKKWYSLGEPQKGKFVAKLSQDLLSGVDEIDISEYHYFLLLDGVLHQSAGEGFAPYPIADEDTKIASFVFCGALFPIMRDGKSFLYLYDQQMSKRYVWAVEELKPFAPIFEVKCAGNVYVFRNKDGWFSFLNDQPTKEKASHLGHAVVGSEIGKVDFPIPEGYELVDFDIGETRSLILARHKSTKKQELFGIGDNSQNLFGSDEIPKTVIEKLTKIPLDPSIPVDKLNRVKVGKYNSFIGNWKSKKEEIRNTAVCNGIPAILTDIVCGKQGTCEMNEKKNIYECRCKGGFKNWSDIPKEYKETLDFFNQNLKILGFEIKIKPILWIGKLFFKSLFDEKLSKIDNCEIPELRIADISDQHQFFNDLIKNSTLVIILLLIICIFICFVCFVVAGTCFTCIACCIIGIPTFVFAVRKGVRKQVKKQKEELLQNLLGQDNSENSNMEMEQGFGDELKKLDLSYFNLDFNDFKIDKEIGSGGSGALCFQAIDKKNGERVFMKMFSLKKNSENDEYDMKEFQNEIKLFTRLRHTNIVNFYGFFCAPPSRVGYICEFCNEGTLSTFLKSWNLKKQKKQENKSKKEVIFDIPKKINYLIQISKGMRYLHQKGIVFRDLKPDNILIGMNDTLKLTDFGISKTINQNANSGNMTMKAGTSLYMAPEVVEGTSDYDQKVDVFSFGILMFDILFETIEPYGPNPAFGIDFKIATNPEFRPEIPKSFMEFSGGDYNYDNVEVNDKVERIEEKTLHALIDLMKRCWKHDPKMRPDFREIVLLLGEIEDAFENTS